MDQESRFWQMYSKKPGYVHVNVFPGLGTVPLFTLSDKTVGFFSPMKAYIQEVAQMQL